MSRMRSRGQPWSPVSTAKPPESWCRSVRNNESHCPLCGEPGMVRISKVGRPFFSCRICHSKLFMNSERAVLQFESMEQVFHTFAASYRKTILSEYLRTSELDAAAIPDAKSEMGQKRDLATREAILKAGRVCILCGGLAEFRKVKKGEFQECRFCSSQVFIHGPLGQAGLITRRLFLLTLYQRRQAAHKMMRPAPTRTTPGMQAGRSRPQAAAPPSPAPSYAMKTVKPRQHNPEEDPPDDQD